MARGRKVNWDAKVKQLVAELRTALVEREKTRLEARVEAMVAGIGHGLETAKRTVRTAAARVARVAKGKRGVYRRSAAQRRAQAAKMRAYWAAKRKGKGKKSTRKGATRRAPRSKPAARPKTGGAWAAMTPEQRAARIAKMQAGRKSP